MWLLYYIFPVLILGLVICAAFITLVLKNRLRIPNYFSIFLFVVLGIPLAYYVPVQIQTIRFKMFSDAIPKAENASKKITYISVFGADSPAYVKIEISGQMPISTTLKFYSEYLKNNSWQETIPTSKFDIGQHYTYTKGSSKLHLIGYTSGQKSEINVVRLQRDYPAIGSNN